VSFNRTGLSGNTKQTTRSAYVMLLVLMLTFFSIAVMCVYLATQAPSWQLYILTFITLGVTIISGMGIRLVQNNRTETGTIITVSAVIIVIPIVSFLISRLGVSLGIAQMVGLTLTISLILPRRQTTIIVIVNGLSALLAILLGVLETPYQLTLPVIQVLAPYVIGLGLLVFLIILFREFRNFGLRAKISLGILITGGVAVGVVSFFAINQLGQLIDTLTQRLNTAVNLLAEEQLVNQAQSEANLADQFFEKIADETRQLAEYRVALQSQQTSLNQNTYWSAEEKLIPLDGGKYGNPSTDISSVFVPSTVQLSDAVIRELNTSAYFDFLAPQLREENPALLAVYYIDERGVVRYYPNIELASLLPHDFDATQRPYYEITTPLADPDKDTRWTVPYEDAAGGGLVVTVAEPVYIRDRFIGVIAADVQLATLTEEVSKIQIGQHGYAFLLDDAGRVLSMPKTGYKMFGLDPDVFSTAEFSEQTVLGKGPDVLQDTVRSMVAGESGLSIVPVDNTDMYVAYTSIPTNGYSLAIVVPSFQLQATVITTRTDIEQQRQSVINLAIIIMVALLAGAIAVSLWLGQVIASPVIRLTNTANQILEGNLSAQAEITSTDETGVLAEAFNAVTAQLGETLLGLERTIDNRTSELSLANQRNEQRARQFQSISKVARTIGSTLDLDSLLSQITNVISREFGFYHVGVFLLDSPREYAVLSAANSDGGQVMLARGHRLKVGEKGLVGFVSGTGKPRVALDTGADAVFFDNPDLPDTRSEVALPLLAGNTVIGVLDVQSTEQNAFTQEDVDILSTLADQVSIAIQNARQNEQTRRALAESNVLSRQFVQTGWEQFIKRQKILGVRHTGAKATLLYSQDANGKNAANRNTGRLELKGSGAVHSIPITLRGEVIGAVDVRVPDNRQWDQDEIDIVSAIIERAAVALENARLLSESQKHAAKERTIGEISARLSAQSNIDDLLRMAAQELARRLPGTEIAIQFRKEETE